MIVLLVDFTIELNEISQSYTNGSIVKQHTKPADNCKENWAEVVNHAKIGEESYRVERILLVEWKSHEWSCLITESTLYSSDTKPVIYLTVGGIECVLPWQYLATHSACVCTISVNKYSIIQPSEISWKYRVIQLHIQVHASGRQWTVIQAYLHWTNILF